MALPCQKEFDFMAAVLEKMRLQIHHLHPGDNLTGIDNGMRLMLGIEEDYSAAFQIMTQWSHERTIYKIMDQFMCNYIYFHLPAATPPCAIVIGPYLTIDPSREMIMELAEQMNISMQYLPQQESFYASLPVFNDPTPILAVVSTFGETLWGQGGAFDMVDINYDQKVSTVASTSIAAPIEHINILQEMKMMEARYAYENELMDIVAKGLTNRAEVMMASVSQLNYQQRLADPLRNMKNYCIICNTLLRKAAQQGGVHPLHLDRMSSQFARSIETSPTLEACSTLIVEMIRAYCRLVRTHAGKHYSAIVQKTLTYIDANLSGDLSLSTLSELMQVTPVYLSALFHRETGVSLINHITTQRMKTGLQLLGSTRLQVQTIAELCGYGDPNYFGKQFKKLYGVTPAQYRKDIILTGRPAGE